MCSCFLVRYFLGSLFFGHLSLHCSSASCTSVFPCRRGPPLGWVIVILSVSLLPLGSLFRGWLPLGGCLCFSFLSPLRMQLPSRLSLFEITSHYLSFFSLQPPLPSGGFSLCSHLCSLVPVISLRILPCFLQCWWPRSLFCVTGSWLVSLLFFCYPCPLSLLLLLLPSVLSSLRPLLPTF